MRKCNRYPSPIQYEICSELGNIRMVERRWVDEEGHFRSIREKMNAKSDEMKEMQNTFDFTQREL